MKSYIDYPGAAHLIIKDFIIQLQWNYYYLLLFLTLLFLLFLSFKMIKNDNILKILIIISLLFFRLPSFIMGTLDPDESQWMSAVNVMLNNPTYWKSIDTTTTGPFNTFFLMFVYKLGFPINYFTIRIILVLLIQFPTILFLYESFKIITNTPKARLAIFPILLLYMFMYNKELVSYNSEQIPNLLLSVSIYCCVKYYYKSVKNELLTGIILGIIPYSKLQFVPVAIFIGCFYIWILWYRKAKINSIFKLIIGTTIPTVIVLLYLLITGEWNDFWISYIEMNLIYAKSGLNNNGIGFPESLQNIPFLLKKSKEFKFLAIGLITMASYTIIYILINKKTKFVLKQIIFGTLFFLFSTWSIIQSGNKFLHYIYIYIIPLSMLSLWNIMNKPMSKFNINIYLSLFICLILLKQYTDRYFMYDILENKETKYQALSLKLETYDKPNDKIAVWGWNNELYIETENIQATRDAITYYQTITSPNQIYYQERFIDDMEDNKPTYFINSIPGRFYQDTSCSFTHYPIIANYIFKNYKLIDENDKRIYVRIK